MDEKDKKLKEIVPYMERDRYFKDYVKKFLTYLGVDIRDLIIDRALAQEEVNFFDLGCGFGNASVDFFSEVSKRLEERQIPEKILTKIKFHGIDKFTDNHVEQDNERINFYYPVDLRDISSYDLPSIDIGVSYFVLPYIDKKLEALASWYKQLRIADSCDSRGELFTTEYNPFQIKILPRDAIYRPSYSVGVLPDASLEEIINGPIISISGHIIRLHRTEREVSIPRFIDSQDEPTRWYYGEPKGRHAGQKVSLYSNS